MSSAIRESGPAAVDIELGLREKISGLWPVVLPVVIALVFIVTRAHRGPSGFLYEGDLTMLALLTYMTAAAVLVTNLFVKERVLFRLGLLAVAAGYAFNFSGWMIRWWEAADAEGHKAGIVGGLPESNFTIPALVTLVVGGGLLLANAFARKRIVYRLGLFGVSAGVGLAVLGFVIRWMNEMLPSWRYFPLDNLYPLTLGFCAGAAITTLVIIRKPKYQFAGALSMPIVTVILALAMFLGNDIRTLPPILDSYWRPIHVSIATIGYGVCLVSFGLAFAYLLKDGVRSEVIAIAVALFGLLVYGTIGRYGVPIHAEYAMAVFLDTMHLPVRTVLPGVGFVMLATLLAILGSMVLFILDVGKGDEKARKWGWHLFRGAALLQGVVLVFLFYQINTVTNLSANIPEREYVGFGPWLAEQMQNSVPAAQQAGFARNWVEQNATRLSISPQSNPVELGGLIGLFVALLLVALFAWRRQDVVDAMPSLQTIDSLLYRTVGVAFPLLALLLITGAVWANESWGRYWGWDSKEVGALVAWMAYAGFLHTRIAHGWTGRRSAYFALLGFALVIFTWLGVSYLLPGLHSYA